MEGKKFMYRRAMIRLSLACVAVMASFILVSFEVAAQATPPIYNPYPPGILPADLVAEIARVRREVQGIFQEALGMSKALDLPVPTVQPSTLQGTRYQAVHIFGQF